MIYSDSNALPGQLVQYKFCIRGGRDSIDRVGVYEARGEKRPRRRASENVGCLMLCIMVIRYQGGRNSK